MKNFTKKIISKLTALSMIFAISANASAFTPRTSLSDEECNSQYWLASQSDGNVFSRNQSLGGGNCTWYAFGRAWELLGKRPSLSVNGAHKWYTYNDGYERGSVPKPGAIACWSDDNSTVGHVAVVEAVNGDNVICSESGWSFTDGYFRLITRNKDKMNYTLGGVERKFQGYIYLPLTDNSPNASIYINEKYMMYSLDSVNMNGTVLVPARDLLESVGGVVDWDNETKTMTAKVNNSAFSAILNSNLIYFNDTTLKTDIPCMLSDSGKTMLPLRAVITLIGGSIVSVDEAMNINISI